MDKLGMFTQKLGMFAEKTLLKSTSAPTAIVSAATEGIKAALSHRQAINSHKQELRTISDTLRNRPVPYKTVLDNTTLICQTHNVTPEELQSITLHHGSNSGFLHKWREQAKKVSIYAEGGVKADGSLSAGPGVRGLYTGGQKIAENFGGVRRYDGTLNPSFVMVEVAPPDPKNPEIPEQEGHGCDSQGICFPAGTPVLCISVKVPDLENDEEAALLEKLKFVKEKAPEGTPVQIGIETAKETFSQTLVRTVLEKERARAEEEKQRSNANEEEAQTDEERPTFIAAASIRGEGKLENMLLKEREEEFEERFEEEEDKSSSSNGIYSFWNSFLSIFSSSKETNHLNRS